jgi:phosphoribosylglycinamide formyltransferase 1
MAKLKIGVLISGSGTNLQAIIDRIVAGTLDAEIVVVISNKKDAYGLERARNAGLKAVFVDTEDYSDFSINLEIMQELRKSGVELVVMAGYMLKLGDPALQAFPNRVINLHPALLPSFKGAHGIDDAFDYGVKFTGVTVHFADANYDTGPIIAQWPVPIHEGDTVDTLEERIHAEEHELLPHVIQMIAEGRVSVEGRRVHIKSK